jgi:4'-phosphopantetheinyl transferase
MSTPNLDQNRIYVWELDLATSPEGFASLWDLLTPDEQHRASRFYCEADQKRFVVGRANLRRILGKALGVEASQIALRKLPSGKLVLSALSGPGDLHFNVSHSSELVLIAAARRREAGIDVEATRENLSAHELAERFFCEAEWKELRELSGRDQQAAFFRCWTRKEAIVKAVGEGLGIPLRSFYVGTGAAEWTTVETEDRRAWKVRSWTPRLGYTASLAAPLGDWDIQLVRDLGS